MVTDWLDQSAGSVFIYVLTFFLGLTVGGLITVEVFLAPKTLAVIGLAALAFVFSTIIGLLGVKLLTCS